MIDSSPNHLTVLPPLYKHLTPQAHQMDTWDKARWFCKCFFCDRRLHKKKKIGCRTGRMHKSKVELMLACEVIRIHPTSDCTFHTLNTPCWLRWTNALNTLGSTHSSAAAQSVSLRLDCPVKYRPLIFPEDAISETSCGLKDNSVFTEPICSPDHYANYCTETRTGGLWEGVWRVAVGGVQTRICREN